MTIYNPARPSYYAGRNRPPSRYNPVARLAHPHTPSPTAPATAGQGSLMQQANMMVRRALAPLLAEVNASYDRQGSQTSASIAAATREYENAVKQYGPAVAGAYQGAVGAQSGTDAALAKLLTGQGAQGATDLAAHLGGLGGGEVPASSQATGNGAGAAGYATGSADVAKLLSSGAGEASYAAKLPGLAALTGLQDTKSALAALAGRRADAIGQITSAGPGQALNLYQNLVARRDTRSEQTANRALQEKLARESGLVSTQKASLSYEQSQQALAERIRKDTLDSENKRYSTQERSAAAAEARSLTQQRLAETSKHDRATEATAAKNAAKQPRTAGKAASGKRETAFYGARTKAFGTAKTLHDGVVTTNQLGEKVVKTPPVTNWKAAYTTLWNQYAPQLLSEYKFTHEAVQTMIQRALKSAGYKVA